MPFTSRWLYPVAVGVLMLASSGSGQAQSLGTFSWQTQPYCNRISATVVQTGAIYVLNGVDDQCGGAQVVPVVGLATPNPDGTIEFGLNLVAANGVPLHLTARLTAPSFNGVWTDSQGASGTLALGAATGGSPRPLPARVAAASGANSSNTSAGASTLAGITTGIQNSAFGYNALSQLTTGNGHTAMGFGALESATTGIRNTGVGYLAARATTSGNDNIAIGARSLQSNTTGSDNVAVGLLALSSSTTTSGNVAVGRQALEFNTASFNTAVGTFAARVTATGSANTVVGAEALVANTTGSNNVAFGDAALRLSTGTDNTALGHHGGIAMTAGNGNVFVGSSAGQNLIAGNNNIYVANPGATQESGVIRLGTVGVNQGVFVAGISGATSSGGVGVLVSANGQLGTTASSRRFKDDITTLGDGELAKLQALRPVRFVYKPAFDDGSRTPQYGLIAEDVAETFPELAVTSPDGTAQAVRYHFLAPLLLAEVQRLERVRSAQDARATAQEDRISTLERLVESLSVARAREQ